MIRAPLGIIHAIRSLFLSDITVTPRGALLTVLNEKYIADPFSQIIPLFRGIFPIIVNILNYYLPLVFLYFFCTSYLNTRSRIGSPAQIISILRVSIFCKSNLLEM
tara:strand:+ start:56 stop:373 length:318 start_codon:yes stop_codon:yes gene_type:complete